MNAIPLLLVCSLTFCSCLKTAAAVTLGIAASGPNEVALSWTSATNTLYNLQWSPVSAPPQWRSLAGLVTATNATATLRDTKDQAARFYRVVTITGKQTLKEENTGTNVVLNAGTLLAVTLAANPSTGYNWVVLPGSEGVVRQLGQPTYVSTSSGVGGGGELTFVFEGVGAGQVALRLIYSRFGTVTGDAVKTFDATVTSAP